MKDLLKELLAEVYDNALSSYFDARVAGFNIITNKKQPSSSDDQFKELNVIVIRNMKRYLKQKILTELKSGEGLESSVYKVYNTHFPNLQHAALTTKFNSNVDTSIAITTRSKLSRYGFEGSPDLRERDRVRDKIYADLVSTIMTKMESQIQQTCQDNLYTDIIQNWKPATSKKERAAAEKAKEERAAATAAEKEKERTTVAARQKAEERAAARKAEEERAAVTAAEKEKERTTVAARQKAEERAATAAAKKEKEKERTAVTARQKTEEEERAVATENAVATTDKASSGMQALVLPPRAPSDKTSSGTVVDKLTELLKYLAKTPEYIHSSPKAQFALISALISSLLFVGFSNTQSTRNIRKKGRSFRRKLINSYKQTFKK